MCRMQTSGLSDFVSEVFRGGFVKDFRIFIRILLGAYLFLTFSQEHIYTLYLYWIYTLHGSISYILHLLY